VSYYFWDSAIEKDECEQLISEYKDSEFSVAKVGGGRPNLKRTDLEYRDTDIIWIKPDRLINRAFYGFVKEANDNFFHYDLDGHEALQLSKYDKDGHYQWHTDNPDINLQTEVIRKLSASIQLSDPSTYEGGEFQLYNGETEPIIPDIKNQGSVIVFDARDWHRITPILSGMRYSLVMWAVGPCFK
tara:strand:+ start:205 stop:762 length:558 start_codon:yes stop_codon:yes gene_type:complete